MMLRDMKLITMALLKFSRKASAETVMCFSYNSQLAAPWKHGAAPADVFGHDFSRVVTMIILAALFCPFSAYALSTEINVSACTFGSCSAAEYNTNDTGVASILAKDDADETNWTTHGIGNSAQIDNVRFRMLYDGDVNTDGQWNLSFHSMDGTIIYCIKYQAQQSGSDIYFDMDANSSCSWTVARIKDLNVTITNNDTSVSGTGTIKFADIFVEYTEPYLEVNLTIPEIDIVTNIIQNRTFLVNANVTCRGAPCSNVNGSLRYNMSSEPDTIINVTLGDKPFFVNETSPLATKTCENPMDEDEACSLTWIVNVSGDVGTNWKMDVLFHSSALDIASNDTGNAIISIIPCAVDLTLQWASISFGELAPNTWENAAPGNVDNIYNITVNDGSCSTDLYISGTNMTNVTLSTEINVTNIRWSNKTNDYAESHNLSEINTLIMAAVAPIINITTWYWINVPPVFAGRYNGTITITGVKNG
jgi:hypothetical protein